MKKITLEEWIQREGLEKLKKGTEETVKQKRINLINQLFLVVTFLVTREGKYSYVTQHSMPLRYLHNTLVFDDNFSSPILTFEGRKVIIKRFVLDVLDVDLLEREKDPDIKILSFYFEK